MTVPARRTPASLPSLVETMRMAIVTEIDEASDPAWVRLTLDNGYQVLFRAGAVIVHPEPGGSH